MFQTISSKLPLQIALTFDQNLLVFLQLVVSFIIFESFRLVEEKVRGLG